MIDNESKRRYGTYQFILFALIISQLCSVFAQYIPKADYIVTFLLVLFMFGVYRRISVHAAIYSVIVLAILVLGIFSSTICKTYNDNVFLAVAIAANCLVYCNMAKNADAKLDHMMLDKTFDYILGFGTISCIYNVIKNLSSIMSLSLTGYSYGAIFSSFYTGRNSFAAFLFLYIALCTYQIAVKKKKIYYVIFGLLCLNLLFTFSRTSILSAVVFIGIFMLEQCSGSTRKKLMLFLLFLVACIVGGIIFVTFYDYIAHYLIRKEYGDAYRFIYWKVAGEGFLNSPLFGHGPGSAEMLLSVLGSISGSSFHNVYIEIGLWGGVFLLVIYGVFFIDIGKALRKIKLKNLVLFRIYTALLSAYFVRCLFESSMLFGMGATSHMITIVVYLFPILYSKSIEREAI